MTVDDNSQNPNNEFSQESASMPDIYPILANLPLDTPDFTQQIMAQLAQDAKSSLPCEYDFEFISAYYDSELTTDTQNPTLADHRIQAFEQHLPHCSPCNDALGACFSVTETYRSYLYRQEHQLQSFDIAASVIQTYTTTALHEDQPDEHWPLPLVGCGQFDLETFSALLDRELTDEIIHAVLYHQANCLDCEAFLLSYAPTSTLVQDMFANLSKEPPLDSLNLWPAVQSKLHKSAKVASLEARQWAPKAIAAIAASLLLVFISGKIFLNPPQPQTASSSVDVAALEAAMIADYQDQQLKSAPVTVNVNYQSPEAYLFSYENNLAPQDTLHPQRDVSAFVLNP